MRPRQPDARRTLWWRTAGARPSTTSLRGELSVDVAVVGAGVTGLTAAFHLARRGARVAVLEAEEVGAGATGRSAGFVVPNFAKADPAAVIARLGEERGRRLLQLVGEGGDRLFQTVRSLGIACDAEQTGWLQPAHSEAVADTLARRAQAWQALGRPVAFLDAAETARQTGMTRYKGALLDRSGGTIHPLNYALGLAAATLDAGAILHEGTPVLAAERTGTRWRVAAPAGAVVAEQLLLCTNAAATGLAELLARMVVPLSVYQIATEPIPAEVAARIAPERRPVSDTRANIFTYRLDRDNRLISGGMAIMPGAARRRMGRRIAERLRTELGLPEPLTPQFVWRGTAAVTPDFLPHLYELGPGFVGAVGCNGRGLAMTTMLGEVLADWAGGAALAELPVPSAPARALPFHSLARFAPSVALAHGVWRDWREAA